MIGADDASVNNSETIPRTNSDASGNGLDAFCGAVPTGEDEMEGFIKKSTFAEDRLFKASRALRKIESH